MMCGVGQIASESPVGIRMTFLTGGHNSSESGVRVRIIDFQDIMRAVTIGTLGCF